MTSICCSPIADNHPYESILEVGMQSSKPQAASDAQPLGFPTCFNLSAADARFRLGPPVGQFLSPGRTAGLSDDPGLASLRNFLTRPKHVIELTLDNDDDDNDDGDDTSQVSWLTNTLMARYHVRLTPLS